MAIKRKTSEILIFSLDNILELIAFNKTDWNIVSIRDSDHPAILYQDFVECRKNYKEIIVERLDDITCESDTLCMANSGHVRRILEWSAGKKKIAVHCHAGISRSSAMAYLIACKRMAPKKALNILDVGIHDPNRHIVRLGASLMGKESVYGEYISWMRRKDKMLISTYNKNAGGANS